MELKKDVRQEIFTGHKVSSPMLFGVKTEGQLGGRTEIAEAYELFQNTYISKRQRILEKVFNRFAALKGVPAHLTIEPTSAIGFGIPESLIAQAMSVDMVKEFLGIPIVKEAGATASAVIDAINSLSPLVANKVLESMTAQEIRGLVGLSGGVVKTTSTTTTDTENPVQMSKHFDESILLDQFSFLGYDRDMFEIIERRELEHVTFFSDKTYFSDDLNALDRAIVDLLNKDNNLPPEELAKALNSDKNTIVKRLNSLIERGYINTSDIENGKAYKPTTEAKNIVEEEGAKTDKSEVLYSYELRHNAPKLLPGGESRPFCRALVDARRLYKKEEIDQLSNGMGLDVWTFKGGWYTNPNTDAPTPQCRHTWVQNVVKRK